jgi:hypothetical protein
MSTSNIALYGQAWELVVTYANEASATDLTVTSNSFEPDALRMTFEVTQSTLSSPYWFADIKIYNLNEQSTQNILQGATWVTLKAGFQTSPGLYSQIWSGQVFQALYTREGVVDEVITLHCVATPNATYAVVNMSTGPGSTQSTLVTRMAQQVGLSISFGRQAAASLDSVSYPRGRGVFGKPMKYMSQLADSHFMSAWQDGKQAYVAEVQNPAATPALIYEPLPGPGDTTQQSALSAGVTQSIIGTPQQTPQGVIFTVLLDPRLTVQLPPLLVQLRNTLLSQLTVTPNSTLAAPIPINLTFLVSQVRHTGDTRGNDWQTEVTGYSTSYANSVLDGIFAAQGGS